LAVISKKGGFMRDLALHRKGERAKLKPRGEPYWAAPLAPNCSIGLRVTPKSMIWTARFKREDGTRTYKKLGRCTDAFDFTQAREAAIKWFKDLERGVDDGSATVETACKAYVEDRRTEVSEANAHDAEMRFKRCVYDATFGKIPLAKIRATQIKAWRSALVEPTDADKRAVSKATANRTLTALKAALNLAVKDRRVSADTAIEWSSVEAYESANNRRDLYLDLAQRRALLNAATGAIRDLIEAVMLTGARAGELTSALRKQFDQRTGTLTLRGGTEGGKTGRGKTGERKVPLSTTAITLFERLAKSKLPMAHLLVRDDGKKWNHSDWDELVRDAATKAELPTGVCLYTLRHTFITTALQGKLAVSDVSLLVGTSAKMIQKHYHHLVDSHVRDQLANVVMA
jgi:integrase